MTSSPWRQLSEQTDEIDALAANAHALVAAVASAREASSGEYQAVMIQAQVARELSAVSARLLHAAEALQVEAAALVESAGVAQQDAMASTRAWLARHNGLGNSHAGMLVRRAEALDRFPVVKAAYLAAGMTLGHLNAI